MYGLTLGDIGTLLKFEIWEDDSCHRVDLSNALTATLYVQFPDGVTTQAHDCIFSASTPCEIGIVNYITVLGDFPLTGTYRLEVSIAFTTGQLFNSEVISLRVGGNIIPPLITS